MLKSEAFNFEKKVTQVLSKGIIAQITVAITHSLVDLTATDVIIVVTPCYLMLHFLEAHEVLQNLVFSIIMNQAFSAVATKELGLSLVNFMSIFLLTSVFEHNEVSGTAQYMFVIQVSNLLQLHNFTGVCVAFALYLQVYHLSIMPRLKDTAVMITMYVVQGWFLQQIPQDAQMPCMFMLLYALSPFMSHSERAVDAYNFILMTFTASLHYNNVSYWDQSVIAALMYVAHFDQISITVGQNVFIRLFTMAIIHSLITLARTDSFLVYGMMMLALRFVTVQLA